MCVLPKRAHRLSDASEAPPGAAEAGATGILTERSSRAGRWPQWRRFDDVVVDQAGGRADRVELRRSRFHVAGRASLIVERNDDDQPRATRKGGCLTNRVVVMWT